MLIIFWLLVGLLVSWYLGALGFAYHVFAFRFPKDITITVFIIFVLIIIPITLLAVGSLAEFYGRL